MESRQKSYDSLETQIVYISGKDTAEKRRYFIGEYFALDLGSA